MHHFVNILNKKFLFKISCYTPKQNDGHLLIHEATPSSLPLFKIRSVNKNLKTQLLKHLPIDKPVLTVCKSFPVYFFLNKICIYLT